MYRALYRKWRPADFDDVYGQQHVTRTLKNEVACGRISHAYLFTGSRGTGKTSCAKILAKAVNCLNPQNGNPCNECEICRGVDNGSLTDVIEIDAASNNGVDNIRDIREEVNFTPAVAKYRVYIIDEVHMLSTGAFNALLKTLEEPPAHVIFILATTDVHKLPPTVLSRCQRFDFKRISSENIVERLKYIAEKENMEITDDAANLIANISDGGMRDAVSLMDSCFSISGSVTAETVSTAAGVAGTDSLFEFSSYIASNDFTRALMLVTKLHNEACDILNLCNSLSSHFRDLMVAKTVKDCEKLVICSDETLAKYKKRAGEISLSKILDCIEILAKTSELIRRSSNKKIQLETAVIKMCGIKDNISAVPVVTGESAAQEPPAAKEIPASQEPPAAPTADEAPAPSAPPVQEPPVPPEVQTGPPAPPAADKEPSVPFFGPPASSETQQKPAYSVSVNKTDDSPIPDGDFTLWPEVCEAVLRQDPPLYAMLSNTTAVIRDNKIIIITDYPEFKNTLLEDNRFTVLDKAIQEVTGRRIRAAVRCTAAQPAPAQENNPLKNFTDKIDEFKNNNF